MPKASSREIGLLMILLFKLTTLSAPRTNWLGFLLLTLIDLISAKFFDIKVGLAPAWISDSFAWSSSTFDGITSQSILFALSIFFLTPLFEANIILIYFF